MCKKSNFLYWVFSQNLKRKSLTVQLEVFFEFSFPKISIFEKPQKWGLWNRPFSGPSIISEIILSLSKKMNTVTYMSTKSILVLFLEPVINLGEVISNWIFKKCINRPFLSRNFFRGYWGSNTMRNRLILLAATITALSQALKIHSFVKFY